MEKALFIVGLKYPLINAINIKVNVLTLKDADILIEDNQKDIVAIAERLHKTKVFDNVFVAKVSKELALKDYFKKNYKSDNISLLDAVIGEKKNFIKSYLFENDKEKFINSSLVYGGKIDLNQYDEVYVCSEAKVSYACTDILCKHKVKIINLIEEGVRDYSSDESVKRYLKRYKANICVHVYDTSLIYWDNNNSRVSFKEIPKLSTKDLNLISILNSTFGYNASSFDKTFWNNKVIFFEQVAEPIPEYLKKLNWWQKILLNNALKKHLKEYLQYKDKCKSLEILVNLLSKFTSLDNFILKLHPRTVYGVDEKYKKFVVGDYDNNINIPWEVYILNNEFHNNVWITLYSSSVLNRLYAFSTDIADIKIVFMYNYIIQNNTRSNLYDTQFSAFYIQINKEIPALIDIQNLDELEEIIRDFANKVKQQKP